MCQPNYGLADGEYATADSPIAGYIGRSSKVVNSAYSVPLKHGIPNQFDDN